MQKCWRVPRTAAGQHWEGENSRCFRVGKPYASYFSQKNVWSGKVIFKRWFYEILLPYVRKDTSHPVALVMDNCGPYGTDKSDCLGQVKVFPSPQNCTSIHLQMDQGVAAEWKAPYSHNLLMEMMEGIENQCACREQNRVKPAGIKGLAEGYEPHILNVSLFCEMSCAEIQQDTLARCCR